MNIISLLGRLRARPGQRPLRLLIWTFLVVALAGAIHIGEPVETMLANGRDLARNRPVSPNMVVVSIDDRSLARVAKWPWPRRAHAQLIDTLNVLGARRIFVDVTLFAASDPEDDRMLAAAIRRARGKVTLAGRYMIDPMTDARTDFLPLDMFRRDAHVAAIDWEYTRFGAVHRLPYSISLAGRQTPSMSAALAGVSDLTDDSYPIDFSLDPRSIPTVSAADVIERKTQPSAIRGRDVIIGPGSLQLGDMWLARGRMIPGVYFHVLGAQTLLAGRPIELPWYLPFALAMIVAVAAVNVRRFVGAMGLLGAGFVASLFAPFFLEAAKYVVEIAPALFVLVIVTINRVWSYYRHSYRLRGTTNIVSGLPNLNGLREDGAQGAVLVAARVHNYAAISSALPHEREKSLVEQIVRRLTLGDTRLKVYQGDEGIFAWSLEVDDIAHIGAHLNALNALLRAPVEVADQRFDVAISFGVDDDATRTLSNRLAGALVAADEALAAGEKWRRYDPSALKDAGWKLSLLGQLDDAIDDGSVWVAFQPKYDFATRQIRAAEALVRWTHPEKGLINPMEFIAAAEQSNRIDKLTFHVLDRAVRAAAMLNAHGIAFGVAVNISMRVFDNPELSDRIDAVLARHRLAPGHLTLEVTETAAFTDGARMQAILVGLRAKGINISLDDYGTGLSTLEYLRNIPANEIKIDKGFVQAMERSASDRLMVHSTIQLAHSLGRTVVAEGVEQADTLEALARMGCDIAQGYYIGRPMPFRALARMLIVERKNVAA